MAPDRSRWAGEPLRERAWVTARRLVLMLAVAALLAQLVLPWRPATLCLLRALTGVPCPFCGGTTAAVAAGRGDVLGALAASPLAVLGSAGYALAPLAPRRVAAAARRHVVPLLVLSLLAAWAWQLVRLS